MDLFGPGNLLTIGIALILIIFFRLLDKSNRSLDKVRKYVDRCKEDMSAYIEDKSSIVKDYGIALEVEKKAAAELMRRIQKLTRDELSQKVQALTQIDDRIQGYDASLTELIQMTGRVQENLNRIRDESAFVEGVAKKLGELREKAEAAEYEIGAVSQKLESVELIFEDRNIKALEKAAETVVDGTRSAIQDLETRLSREEGRIEALFAEAVEKAGSRADKVEEAALAKLRGQAEERLALVKTSFEEKLKSLQDTVKAGREELQDLVKRTREEWQTEAAAMEEQKDACSADARQFKEEWERQMKELTAFMEQQARDAEAAVQDHEQEMRTELRKHREGWGAMYHDAGLEVAANIEEKLEGYRRAQEELFRQFSSVTNDSAKLEKELRRAMKEAEKRVNDDFTRFGKDVREAWKGSTAEFKDDIKSVRTELADVEKGLADIKESATRKIAGKLKTFEDECLADISKRSTAIDRQIIAWESALDSRLEALGSDAETKRKRAETRITDTMKKDYAAMSEKIMADLDSLKARAASFEEKMATGIREAEESRKSLGEQLERNIADAKSTMESIRQESTAMSQIFERSGTFKKELLAHDETLKDSAERLSQLKSDMGRLENQIAQVRRLEDDISTSLNRFTAERRRIEKMENDFDRLIKTSQSVESKLVQVSGSDDMLQAVQIKIRQLDDVMKESDEKFKRVEQKNQTLQETNDGIDRNFRALQESELLLKRLDDAIGMLKTDVATIQNSVDSLSSENEKTLEAAEKLSTLDDSIAWLESRIEEMNKARESAVRLATEISDLDKDAQNQLKLTRSLLKQSSGRPVKGSDDGAPPPRDRDNIIRLRRQGWDIDEIARSMGISKGEVELTLELAPKDL